MQYYQLQFTPVFTVTACCNLDVQYLSSTYQIELSCQITAWMYSLNGGRHYNQFNEAIEMKPDNVSYFLTKLHGF